MSDTKDIEAALQYQHDLGFDEGYQACQQEYENRDEPEIWYECPKCGCHAGIDSLHGGGYTIYMDVYQIPFNYCPKCGEKVEL